MVRPIVYDVTHLVHRFAYDAPSGIDRVDLAYGRHFGLQEGKLAAAIHYGNHEPQVLEPSHVAEAVRRLEERWRETISIEDDPVLRLTKAWLEGRSVERPAELPSTVASIEKKFRIGILPLLRYSRYKGRLRRSPSVPKGAIYLNVAQHAMEFPKFFAWLTKRPDIQRVFFLHDLLPLDHPEFWWAGHTEIFERRVSVMGEHATALITSSEVVKKRAQIEMARHGKPDIPIFAQPLPSPIEIKNAGSCYSADLFDKPYFVVISTIEPRKNHLLLLNIWRELALGSNDVPKLIIIGKRGWENGQTVGLLDRCAALQSSVLEISGCSNAGLRTLVANARGLLMPSFAEGYGLPLVEALSLGTPVVASDIPVFRESSQGKAIFLNPIDGLGWRAAILQLANRASPLAQSARAAAKSFVPQTTEKYFGAIDAFLASL